MQFQKILKACLKTLSDIQFRWTSSKVLPFRDRFLIHSYGSRFWLHSQVLKGIFLCMMCIFSTSALFAYDPSFTENQNKLPIELEGLGIKERLGNVLDKNQTFTDENGTVVKLADYLNHGKPLFLTLVYYECPTLCGYHLQGVMRVLKELELSVGKEFTFVAVSIDPKETPALAKMKKDAFLREYQRGDGAGWHILTGTENEIHKLAEAVGFRYKWNPKSSQWIHASAAYIITPEGKISRYLHGIEFDNKTLRLSLLEAGEGKIGSLMDKITMFCFQYDPRKKSYTLYAYNIMKIGGAFTVLVVAAFLFLFWRKQFSIKNINNQGVN